MIPAQRDFESMLTRQSIKQSVKITLFKVIQLNETLTINGQLGYFSLIIVAKANCSILSIKNDG